MSDTARRILLAILNLGVVGISAELLLLGHDEDFNQLIPLALAGATLAMSAAVGLKPGSATIRIFQMVMVLLVLSGAVGMYLHFQVNVEFQLEMDPALKGMALLQKAILAKTPPALAPGAMTQLGLIGLAYTYKHPALGPRRTL
ncbi:MAG TPA: hypothetical protein VF491_08070 [Vicinamibacterales bacterium]|jgi:hypothetical protein